MWCARLGLEPRAAQGAPTFLDMQAHLLGQARPPQLTEQVPACIPSKSRVQESLWAL